jgi:hypothetical protein
VADIQVLFLDIDGVLNSWQSAYLQVRRGKKGNTELCPIALSNLSELMVKNPELKIVVSSTWRLFHTIVELKDILTKQGFEHADRIIGYTPELMGERIHEINKWLEECPDKVVKYLILDDNQVAPEGSEERIEADNNMILTKQHTGFDWYDLLKANDHFGGAGLGICLM